MAVRTIGGIAVQLNARTATFQKRFAVAEKTLIRFSNRAEMLGKKMVALGKTMTMAITLPLVGFAAVGVKAFGSLDQAMTESLAIMSDVSAVMRKDLTDMAKQMSTETTFAAKTLAKGYFYLASAGMSAAQSLKALAPASKFAQAGAFDLSLAVDLLTDAQSALGLTTKNAEENMRQMTKVSDVLVKANTLANATVQQFSESLTRQAGPAMKELNMSIEEGVAILAAFADQGIKAELAGGYLARSLRLLGQGAVKHKATYEKLGIVVFDNQGKMRKMADIVEDLTRELVPMSDELRTVTFEQLGFAARTRMAIAPLMGLSEKIRDYERELRDAGGTTEMVAKKQLKTLSAQLKILWNRIVNAAGVMGELLVPTVKKLARWIENTVEWFNRLSVQQKKNILKWSALVAAIGPVLIIIGKVSLGIAALTKATVLLTNVFGKLMLKTPAIVTSLHAINAASIASKAGIIGLAGAVGYFTGRLLNWLTRGALEDWMTNLWKFLGITERKLSEFERRNVQLLKRIQEARSSEAKKEGVAIEKLEKQLKSLNDDWNKRLARSKKIIASYKEEGRSVSGLTSILNRQRKAYANQKREIERLIKIRERQAQIGSKTGVPATQAKATNALLTMEENLQARILKIVQKRKKTEGDLVNLRMSLGRMQEQLEQDLQKEHRFTRGTIKEKRMALEEVMKMLKSITLQEEEKIKSKPFEMGAGGQYAAAVEKGTVEAYRTELAQQKVLSKVEKNTKDQVKGTDKLIKAAEKIVESFQPVADVEVVTI